MLKYWYKNSTFSHLIWQLIFHILLDSSQHERFQDHVQAGELIWSTGNREEGTISSSKTKKLYGVPSQIKSLTAQPFPAIWVLTAPSWHFSADFFKMSDKLHCLTSESRDLLQRINFWSILCVLYFPRLNGMGLNLSLTISEEWSFRWDMANSWKEIIKVLSLTPANRSTTKAGHTTLTENCSLYNTL